MCQNVLCVVNVQHDCASAGCAQTTNEAIRQEREVSASTRKIIQHTKTNMYILNTYSIHNYKDIRDAIPQELPPRQPSVHGATVRAAAVATMARKKEDAARAKTTAPCCTNSNSSSFPIHISYTLDKPGIRIPRV